MNSHSSSVFNPKVIGLTLFAFILAFAVVVMGAYVRLSNAGISCPDWPTCYGHIGVPKTKAHIDQAHKNYPTAEKVQGHKAWKEMIHRYMAGTLGLMVFFISFYIIRRRKEIPSLFRLAVFLSVLIVFQAALGAFTVTIKLMPIIVTSHLLFGFAMLVSLWVMYFRQKRLVIDDEVIQGNGFSKLVMAGIVVLLVQIFLGGWTTSNYAQGICPDFPTCQDKQWLPVQDFKRAFVIQTDTSINYQGGNLKRAARVSIHMLHRAGAVLTFLLLLIIGLLALVRKGYCGLRSTGLAMLLVLTIQLTLGIGNILLHIKVPVAAAHNGVGALLLLLMVTLYLRSRRASVSAQQ